MALQSRVTEPVDAESLEETWELVGSGGFGCVYKAKHKGWRINVAIKLLDRGVGLKKEADIMDLVSGSGACNFFPRVYGLLQGCPPIRGMSEQQGIVMEFMRRGSVESLQKDLGGPPPWPLAFRLAYEVALGLNFLHSKNLVHSDLKPSNVLLDDDFHAKLADFGLSRVSTSVLINNGESTGLRGGTYKYMPPEAFGPSYKLVRSFDIYSYGIFLWSVLTGKEPYEQAYNDSQVALTVPRGERPSLDDIDQRRSEGLKELVELMPRCWDEEPTKRPDFKECLDVTEEVSLMHEKGIPDAVSKVLTRLGTPGVSPLTPEQPSSHDTVDLLTPENSGRRKTEQPSSHDTVDLSTPENSGTRKTKQQHLVRKISDADKARFVEDNRAKLIQRVSEVMAVVDQLGTMVHPETYSKIENKPTSQDKMRELFQSTIRSGGENVKAAFYDILREDYPDLVTSLGGEL